MKKLYHIVIIVMLSCNHIVVSAQSLGASTWMALLDDTITISSLSIPGAHDAATGEGMQAFPGLGTTQVLGLSEQWECGVRAFDLRPAVRDSVLHIYHGMMRTKVSFLQVLDTLCTMLKQNPRELAIVLLREESDSENMSERALWSALVGNAISQLGDMAAIFTPSMTLGDARGKILFLSRNQYEGTDKGAYICGWNHSESGTSSAGIYSYADGAMARLQLQDYYAPTNDEKRANKLSAVRRFLDIANESLADVWTINHLSGYFTTWFGCTGMATTSGYKRNAAWLHPLVLEYISENADDMNRHLGIVFMDFVGVDGVGGSWLNWHDYDVLGVQLVRTIIESNFNL